MSAPSTQVRGSVLTTPVGFRFNALMNSALAGLGVFAVVAVLLQVTSIGCPIKLFSGLSCPGCGLTRAWESALTLNIADAIRFHPLFWVVPLVFFALAVSKNKKMNTVWGILFGTVALCFVALWVIRLGYDGDFSMIIPAASGDPPLDIVGWQSPEWWKLFTGLFQC